MNDRRRTAGGDDDLGRQIRDHVARARGSGREHSTTSLGPVTAAEADMVFERAGIRIGGHDRIVQSSDIRHVFKSHGDATVEQARGQEAITRADLMHIPAIVAQAHDVVAIGRPGAAKPLRLCYTARIGGFDYRYVEEVRRGIVALKSLLKMPR